MDDMTAYEQQLSAGFKSLMGPSEPVDDAAIFTTITATQSPKWRFRSMFNVAKFVVAGAIVALFGGFLLAGVLTQPNLESVPAVVASASPTPQVTASEQPDILPGAFHPADSLSEARWFHTATLLPDGRVLVVGGWGSDGPLRSVEVWDPATESFSPTGSVAGGRVGHTATLLPDGRVLIVGGATPERAMLRSAEIWDPATENFGPAGTLMEAHGEHTATLLPDGRVLIVGGNRRFQSFAQTAEVWDPETKSFGPADLLAATRFYHTATLLGDGRVLIVGGEGPGDNARIADPPAEVWDPATGSSSPAGSLAEGRFQHTATLLRDGRVLVVGGESHSYPIIYAPTSIAEVWDPETGSFDPAGSPLVQARRGHTATLLPDGRVLVVGGDSGYVTNDTDTYAVHATAEIWDPQTASFSATGSLAEGRAYHTATLLPDGRILVVGGGVDGGDAMASAEIWEPGDRPPPADDATTSTAPDLLPDVDLITEEVDPGVYRVLSDGVREFGHSTPSRNLSLTFKEDGSLWTASLGLLSRLGSGETVRAPAPGAFGRGELAAGPDGMPWVAWASGCGNVSAPRISSFDGQAWTMRSDGMDAPASGSDPRWPPDLIVDLAVGHDGVAWAVGRDCGDETQNDDDAHTRLLRLGPDGWSAYRIGDGLPMLDCSGSCGEGWNIEITPDGTVWLGVPGGGLLRFDGSAWDVVRPLGGDGDHGVISLASNEDGVLWAETQTDDAVPWNEARLGKDRLLARFDGRAWEVFPYVPDGDDAGPGPGLIQAVGPDGTVWLTDANAPQDRGVRVLDDPELEGYRWTPFPVSFDGERWRRYPQVLIDWASDPLAELERWQGTRESTLGVDQIAVGPDGTVWLAVGVGNSDGYRAGLYAITPQAVAPAE